MNHINKLSAKKTLSSFIMMLSLVFSILIVTSSAGCKGPTYPGCKKDNHCKRNDLGQPVVEYCIDNQCLECRADTDCSGGKVCKSGVCASPSACPCPSNQYCSNNECFDKCSNNGDCDSGQVCNNNGECQNGCVSDIECGEGALCINGQCEITTSINDFSNMPAQCVNAAKSNFEMDAIYFDFNTDSISSVAINTVQKSLVCFSYLNDKTIVLEGHCDERGTQEFNLALGENRGYAVKKYLATQGVDAGKIKIVSKGKLEPLCYEQDERCHAQNRRVEIKVQ